MDNFFNISANLFREAVIPSAVFLITIMVGYAIRKIIFLRLAKWTENTKTRVDGIIIAAVKGPFVVWFLILRVKEFVDQYLIKHEFIKRLHERYKKEGIIIPYPIRTIHYEQIQEKKE